MLPLPEELVPIRLACPPWRQETDVGYARRLDSLSQSNEPAALVDGNPLTADQLSSLSGALRNVVQRQLISSQQPNHVP
jgi:hypothetical protein